MSSGSIRQPPPGAAVACHSSSKPSSGVGRTAAASRRRAARGAARSARAGAPARRVDLHEVADHLEPRRRAPARRSARGRPPSGSCCRPRTAAGSPGTSRRNAASRLAAAQQVQAHAHVGVEEAVAVQRRLARCPARRRERRLPWRLRRFPDAVDVVATATSAPMSSSSLPRTIALIALAIVAALTAIVSPASAAPRTTPYRLPADFALLNDWSPARTARCGSRTRASAGSGRSPRSGKIRSYELGQQPRHHQRRTARCVGRRRRR